MKKLMMLTLALSIGAFAAPPSTKPAEPTSQEMPAHAKKAKKEKKSHSEKSTSETPAKTAPKN